MSTEWIKYMKSSAPESIRKACFSLEPLSCSFRLARPGISPLDRLWNAFDSDAALSPNLVHKFLLRVSVCKQFDRNEHFSPSEFSSAGIKIRVWIDSAGLNNLGRPYFEYRFGLRKVQRLNRDLVRAVHARASVERWSRKTWETWAAAREVTRVVIFVSRLFPPRS